MDFIATFVSEQQKNNNKQLKYNEDFCEVHSVFCFADAIF